MSFREFTTHNRWQKVLAFVFAILIWLTVRQGIDRRGGPPVVPDAYSRTFEHLPIRVLTLAADLDQFRVNPSEVTVVLRGRPEILEHLNPQEVEVYVNLADQVPQDSERRPVHVNAPGAQVGSVSPEEVTIERVTSPPQAFPRKAAP